MFKLIQSFGIVKQLDNTSTSGTSDDLQILISWPTQRWYEDPCFCSILLWNTENLCRHHCRSACLSCKKNIKTLDPNWSPHEIQTPSFCNIEQCMQLELTLGAADRRSEITSLKGNHWRVLMHHLRATQHLIFKRPQHVCIVDAQSHRHRTVTSPGRVQ